MFKHIISMIISIIIGIQCIQADEGRVVKVGGYHFPPFVVDDHEAAQGISIDFIHLLNNIQQKYTFDFFLTSSKRRFNHFNHGKYDMILFESIDWGWKNRNVDASIVYFEGGSKYITRAEPGKDQSYFNSFNGKSILLIHGYHYGFCNYQTDEQYLKKNFNASLTSTHEGNIRSVIRGRADMTVVILSFFQKFLHEHPSLKQKILVSDKYDLKNYYTILIRKNAHPDITEINQLLEKMKSDGTLNHFFSQYGIPYK